MDKYDRILEMWKSYEIKTEKDLLLRLDNFRILFAYHSGKIENQDITYHDTREIFENGKVLNFTGDPRTIFEQQNQKLCFEFLKSKIIQKVPITIDLVRNVHLLLTSGTYDERRFIVNDERPGEFKKHDYITGIHEVGTSAEMVEKEIADVLAEINSYEGEDYLKVAAFFHANFENIHPFADGNGRVGRTLLNYYLLTNEHPPVIIYDEDKRFYYAALEVFDSEGDLHPLYEFLKYELEKTWDKTLQLSMEDENDWDQEI